MTDPGILLQYKCMFEPTHYGLTGKDAKTLAQSLEARIRGGRLAPGARVPTVRSLAEALGLSPTTVAAAYRELGQRGVLKGDRRNGTRRRRAAAPGPAALGRGGARGPP